jgi:hypothetical protein
MCYPFGTLPEDTPIEDRSGTAAVQDNPFCFFYLAVQIVRHKELRRREFRGVCWGASRRRFCSDFTVRNGSNAMRGGDARRWSGAMCAVRSKAVTMRRL